MSTFVIHRRENSNWMMCWNEIIIYIWCTYFWAQMSDETNLKNCFSKFRYFVKMMSLYLFLNCLMLILVKLCIFVSLMLQYINPLQAVYWITCSMTCISHLNTLKLDRYISLVCRLYVSTIMWYSRPTNLKWNWSMLIMKLIKEDRYLRTTFLTQIMPISLKARNNDSSS